jgi:glucose-6-phosphate 1-dehydrogenase
VAETVGVERRGGYYDHTGALRDMVPNHLLQVLSLTAMEPPSSLSSSALRGEQVKVLEAAPPLSPRDCRSCVVRAQYEAGEVEGVPAPGYREEPRVAPGSITETYVALKLAIDNWRWAGVPFFLRTGKALARRTTDVVIRFRQPPLMLFAHAPHDGEAAPHAPEPNILRLRIQPDEGIALHIGLKAPGAEMVLRPVPLNWSYREAFGVEPREAYERLLRDALAGDRTLFLRDDEVEASWALMEPVIKSWAQGAPAVLRYSAGSWGPPEAAELLGRAGEGWINL